MKRHQAFKYQLMPNGEQQRQLARAAGSCRFVFNKALALRKNLYKEEGKSLSYVDLCTLLKDWKKEEGLKWLSLAPAQALQQSLKDLDTAYTNFFAKRASAPRFKKRGQRDSFRYPQGCKLDQPNKRIFLPKLGWVRYRHSRDVLGTIKNVTVSKSAGKWFVSIQTEREVEPPVHQGGAAVGIDMGIARFATLSDGSFIEPLNSFRRHEAALRKAQQAMSRKVKFSQNWKKAKAKVQKIHARIAQARKDFLHKNSTTISKNHAIVFLEDLKVRNMSKSAAGTGDDPGKNVRAKSGLNKAILDQGWFEFRRQLEYKLAWQGGPLVAVPPHYTSQTCPKCGYVGRENRPTQTLFKCVQCSYSNHADVVGAMNVLRAGHARLACEVNLIRDQQQEPTEVTQDS